MKHLLLTLVSFFATLPAFSKQESEPFAGAYYRGDHLGYNVTLVLQKNGDYEAWWDGCLGRYGTAKGRWEMKDGKLALSPSEEVGMMKGHLRVLIVRRFEGRFELLPNEDDKRMKTEEEKRMFSFTKVTERKEANRAPKPTSGLTHGRGSL